MTWGERTDVEAGEREKKELIRGELLKREDVGARRSWSGVGESDRERVDNRLSERVSGEPLRNYGFCRWPLTI